MTKHAGNSASRRSCHGSAPRLPWLVDPLPGSRVWQGEDHGSSYAAARDSGLSRLRERSSPEHVQGR